MIENRKTYIIGICGILAAVTLTAFGVIPVWAGIALVNYNLIEMAKRSATKKLQKGNKDVKEQIQLQRMQKFYQMGG